MSSTNASNAHPTGGSNEMIRAASRVMPTATTIYRPPDKDEFLAVRKSKFEGMGLPWTNQEIELGTTVWTKFTTQFHDDPEGFQLVVRRGECPGVPVSMATTTALSNSPISDMVSMEPTTLVAARGAAADSAAPFRFQDVAPLKRGMPNCMELRIAGMKGKKDLGMEWTDADELCVERDYQMLLEKYNKEELYHRQRQTTQDYTVGFDALYDRIFKQYANGGPNITTMLEEASPASPQVPTTSGLEFLNLSRNGSVRTIRSAGTRNVNTRNSEAGSPGLSRLTNSNVPSPLEGQRVRNGESFDNLPLPTVPENGDVLSAYGNVDTDPLNVPTATTTSTSVPRPAFQNANNETSGGAETVDAEAMSVPPPAVQNAHVEMSGGAETLDVITTEITSPPLVQNVDIQTDSVGATTNTTTTSAASAGQSDSVETVQGGESLVAATTNAAQNGGLDLLSVAAADAVPALEVGGTTTDDISMPAPFVDVAAAAAATTPTLEVDTDTQVSTGVTLQGDDDVLATLTTESGATPASTGAPSLLHGDLESAEGVDKSSKLETSTLVESVQGVKTSHSTDEEKSSVASSTGVDSCSVKGWLDVHPDFPDDQQDTVACRKALRLRKALIIELDRSRRFPHKFVNKINEDGDEDEQFIPGSSLFDLAVSIANVLHHPDANNKTLMKDPPSDWNIWVFGIIAENKYKGGFEWKLPENCRPDAEKIAADLLVLKGVKLSALNAAMSGLWLTAGRGVGPFKRFPVADDIKGIMKNGVMDYASSIAAFGNEESTVVVAVLNEAYYETPQKSDDPNYFNENDGSGDVVRVIYAQSPKGDVEIPPLTTDYDRKDVATLKNIHQVMSNGKGVLGVLTDTKLHLYWFNDTWYLNYQTLFTKFALVIDAVPTAVYALTANHVFSIVEAELANRGTNAYMKVWDTDAESLVKWDDIQKVPADQPGKVVETTRGPISKERKNIVALYNGSDRCFCHLGGGKAQSLLSINNLGYLTYVLKKEFAGERCQRLAFVGVDEKAFSIYKANSTDDPRLLYVVTESGHVGDNYSLKNTLANAEVEETGGATEKEEEGRAKGGSLKEIGRTEHSIPELKKMTMMVATGWKPNAKTKNEPNEEADTDAAGDDETKSDTTDATCDTESTADADTKAKSQFECAVVATDCGSVLMFREATTDSKGKTTVPCLTLDVGSPRKIEALVAGGGSVAMLLDVCEESDVVLAEEVLPMPYWTERTVEEMDATVET